VIQLAVLSFSLYPMTVGDFVNIVGLVMFVVFAVIEVM